MERGITMNILSIIAIIFLIIVLGLYAFWLKLKKGKPGRIQGHDVEKKTYEEALVVDVRWRKEIILYCVVDVTSRATEKLLLERGFTKLHIGDGVKQYDYGKAIYTNALLSEFKYRLTKSKNKQLLNLGTEILNDDEIKISPTDIDSVKDKLDKNADIFVYSDTPEESKPVCKKLGKEGYTIINLIEPFYTKQYRNAFYNPKDYDENPAEQQATCNA